jgi:hypothetical protein
MYQVTRIKLELLTLNELFKVRDAIEQLMNLDIQEVDIDVRHHVNALISLKEQSRG